MSRVTSVMLVLWLLLFANLASAALLEVVYSGTFGFVFYGPDPQSMTISPGMPWTARLRFDDRAANLYPPNDVDNPGQAAYQGIRIDLRIGSSLRHFTPVSIGVLNNADLTHHGGPFIDSIDVLAGPTAELYLGLYDWSLTAIHSSDLPTNIRLADWPNHDIVFSPLGVYATGPINRITNRVVPEPARFILVGIGLSVIAMCRRRRGAFVLAVTTIFSLAVSCDHANAAQSMFMGLGDLPGGAFDSRATGVSADGAVVVGTGSTASGYEAFRWTIGTGMVGLGATSTASDVSVDGAVVVGQWGSQAFRWTQSTGIVGLGDFPGGLFQSSASAVSADGSVVVGRGARQSCIRVCVNVFPAFRWTQNSGMVQVNVGTATDISADGTVIVGGASQAARWTEAGGGETLGDLPGGSINSFAWGVSADGSVIVGQGHSDAGPEAFRWTQDGGMVGIGILPGFYSSQALDVSANGSVVVGFVMTDIYAPTYAFIWDEFNHMRSLRDVLINEYGLGASLAGWTLISANAISADGQVVVGLGTNPNGNTEAWLARIALQSSLSGDYNNDGTVDAADYIVWRKTGGPSAEYNTWRTNFGRTAGGGSASNTTVPEPAAALLLVLGAAIGCWRTTSTCLARSKTHQVGDAPKIHRFRQSQRT